MQCHEFEQQLNQLLDDCPDGSVCAGALPSALAEHSGECDDCRTVLGGYRMLFAGLARPAEAVSSNQFVERVLSEATARPRRQKLLRTIVPIAIAASVVLVLSTVLLTRKDSQNIATVSPPPLAPQVAEARYTTPDLTPMPASLPAENLGAAGEESIVSYRGIEFEQPSMGTVLNLAGLRPVTFSAQMLETQWSQQPPWMVEVADGLKPVTESMTGTLNALLRVLPGNATPEARDQGARYDRYVHYDQIA
jgi:hypothetical protein